MQFNTVEVMSRYLSLPLFLLLVVGGGTAIGMLTAPGPWYAQLAKPAFDPPNWVFGPVWTALYILIAIAGWRIWRHGRLSAAMWAWWGQLALNFLWSPAFFEAHRIGIALAIIALMLAAIVLFMVLAWRRDRLAALLFVPYAAWVAFATALNGAIYALN